MSALGSAMRAPLLVAVACVAAACVTDSSVTQPTKGVSQVASGEAFAVGGSGRVACSVNIELFNSSGQLERKVLADVVLSLDEAASASASFSVYAVLRGNGTYSFGDDRGRIRVTGGRWPTYWSPQSPQLSVDFLGGPSKGSAAVLDFGSARAQTDGTAEFSGGWVDPATSVAGSTYGYTNCPHPR